MKKQIGVVAVTVTLIAAGIGGLVWAKSAADTRAHDEERDAVVQAVVERVAASDAVVIAVDDAVSAEMTTATQEEVGALWDQIDPAIEGLQGVDEEIERIRGEYKRLDETPLDAVGKSVDGRISMLTVGKDILALDIDTAVALGLIDEGWTAMIEAQEHSSAAMDAANQHTTEGLVESAFRNNAAHDSLNAARDAFVAANEIIPSDKIGAVISYLELRLEANRLARETDSALARNDVEGANALVDPYNEAENKAVEGAQGIVATPKELIKDEYDLMVADLIERYETARATTAESDGIVREQPEPAADE